MPAKRAEHPFVGLRKNKKIKRSDGEAMLVTFLQNLINLPTCVDVQGRPTSCECLHRLRDKQEWLPHMATYLFTYCKKSPKLRNDHLIHSIQMHCCAGSTSALFPLPSHGAPQGSDMESCCKHAFFRMLGVGREKFSKILKAAKTNTTHAHGLVGMKSNNALHDDIAISLHAFFEEMTELSAPRATRFVRMAIGDKECMEEDTRDCTITHNNIRDQDVDLLELPTNWTKRRLYGKWVATRGWKSSLQNDKGQIKLSRLANFDGDPLKVCVIGTFLSFWKKNYPKLVLPKARRDICTECFILSHTFRHFTNHQHLSLDGDENCTKVNNYEKREKALEVAKVHVEQAQAQRLYFNEISKTCTANNHVLVMDFCQNMGLPYLGSEQSGATYYYSPLNVYAFGIVNMATDHLDTFIYHEGEGRKGGNNVSSMIWRYLIMNGMIKPEENGRRMESLRIVMDNCSGQNKNRMVLRLGLYLVECGYYSTVEFVFLVVGHTKNPCDRMFNLLKTEYRSSNVYTMEQLLCVLNTNEKASAIRMNEFYNWDAYLDKLYKRFESGTVHKSHVFNVTETTDATKNIMKIMISTRADDGQHTVSRNFNRKFNTLLGTSREEFLRQKPSVIPPNGIPIIKQVELGTKWRPNVPVEYQDVICPIPPQWMKEKLKIEKKEKERIKKEKKKKGANTQKKSREEEMAVSDENSKGGDDESADDGGTDSVPIYDFSTQAYATQQQRQQAQLMLANMQYNPYLHGFYNGWM